MRLVEIETDLESQGVEHYLSFAIPNIPEIKLGDDLGRIIIEKSELLGGLCAKDVLVVASKIVSKAEGRIIDTSELMVTDEAVRLSDKIKKPPQVCQAILNESDNYTVRDRGVLIARHKLGYTLTSAGVDRVDGLIVSLIPENPDLSANKIRERIEVLLGKEVSVLISDSEGREDRSGAGAICLGISGMNPLRITESKDPSGRIKTSEETFSDFLAAAAAIIIGQRGRQTPVAVIRGIHYTRDLESSMSKVLHR